MDKKFEKQEKGKNWRLQKGAKVEWTDGHKKRTGVVVKPVNDETNLMDGFRGRKFFGDPTSFVVKDDATGTNFIVLARSLTWLKKV